MNRLRIVIFSLLVLALVAGALPVTDSLAKWSRSAAIAPRHRRHRRHSRAWWRRHRALVRERRERAEQRRQQRLADPDANGAAVSGASAAGASLLSFGDAHARTASSSAPMAAGVRTSSLPFDFEPPHTWTPLRRSRAGEAVFAVQTPEGRAVGTAVVSPVSLSAAQLSDAPAPSKAKSVGGISIAVLRRTVIDRMVAEGGWVTNDFVKEMHGRRVFVVLAQTGAPGAPAQSCTFYFTEIDGRVYSLATTTAVEFAEPVAAGSEQFMASLRSAVSKNLASQK